MKMRSLSRGSLQHLLFLRYYTSVGFFIIISMTMKRSFFSSSVLLNVNTEVCYHVGILLPGRVK